MIIKIESFADKYGPEKILQVYDPETDSWTFGANMPTYRISLGFALVNDTLYAIGGMTYEPKFFLTQTDMDVLFLSIMFERHFMALPANT